MFIKMDYWKLENIDIILTSGSVNARPFIPFTIYSPHFSNIKLAQGGVSHPLIVPSYEILFYTIFFRKKNQQFLDSYDK